ncbi:MAG TPA: hypothetical protein VK454_13110 [Myxococcaceae bacterium]|nr:hypothetical protein [Myxococcaceae bacterium]
MKVKGRIAFADLGAGAWTLEADDGRRYQLLGAKGDLLREGAQVVVEGEVDTGAVSTAMAGPVLRVHRWHAA